MYYITSAEQLQVTFRIYENNRELIGSRSFIRLQTLDKFLKAQGEELVARIVEVEAVRGVFRRDLGIVGVESELVVEVENGNVELLCGLFNYLNVSDESLCVGALDGAGRGLEIIDIAVAAARGSHKDHRFSRICIFQVFHQAPTLPWQNPKLPYILQIWQKLFVVKN